MQLAMILRYFVLDQESPDNYKFYSIKSEYVADHQGEQDVIAIIVLSDGYLIVNKNENEFEVTKEEILGLNVYKYVKVN